MEETVEYKDKVPIVHLWAESTKEPDEFDLREREINQLSRRLATNSIPLLTAIPFFSVKGRHH
jgi:hypothetical protein